MAWFKKEDEAKVPEKYRGMTPEQIAAKLEEAETLAADKAALTTATGEKDAAINAASNTIKQMQTDIKNLEMNQKPKPEVRSEDDIDFTLDPEGALNQRLSRAVVPVAITALKANANVAREQARRSLQNLKVPGTNVSKAAAFDKYSAEIDAMVANVNLQNLQDPNQWVFIFNNVMGSKMDDIINKKDEFFTEPASSSHQRQDESNREVKLTPQEELIAKRMKITPEQYLKNKKEMTFA